MAIRTELTPAQVMLEAHKGRLVPVSGVLIRCNPGPSVNPMLSGLCVSAKPLDSSGKAWLARPWALCFDFRAFISRSMTLPSILKVSR